MPRRTLLAPHVTNDELEDVQAERRITLQARPELIRSTTLFHWWPQRIPTSGTARDSSPDTRSESSTSPRIVRMAQVRHARLHP